MPRKEKTTYGLIGNPVAHSLSPFIHNTAFKELGVEAVYRLFPLEEMSWTISLNGWARKNARYSALT